MSTNDARSLSSDDPCDARANVSGVAERTVAGLAEELALANGEGLENAPHADELLGVDADALAAMSAEELIEAGQESIYAGPLCVESTRVFEVVLGTGGPDTRLLIECDMAEVQGSRVDTSGAAGLVSYEPRRVALRYSWSGSAEHEYHGEARETVLEYARRVVPELAE